MNLSTVSRSSADKSTFAAATGGDSTLGHAAELLGRVLLSLLFLMAGIGKVTAYAATTGYMAAVGVPGVLLPIVILLEIVGAIAVIAGWKTRIVSVLLAGFTVLAGLLFHSNFGDQIQMITFLKNLSIAGGFLVLAVHGAGRFSVDARQSR
jgi:putative oxidoreductase